MEQKGTREVEAQYYLQHLLWIPFTLAITGAGRRETTYWDPHETGNELCDWPDVAAESNSTARARQGGGEAPSFCSRTCISLQHVHNYFFLSSLNGVKAKCPCVSELVSPCSIKLVKDVVYNSKENVEVWMRDNFKEFARVISMPNKLMNAILEVLCSCHGFPMSLKFCSALFDVVKYSGLNNMYRRSLILTRGMDALENALQSS